MIEQESCTRKLHRKLVSLNYQWHVLCLRLSMTFPHTLLALMLWCFTNVNQFWWFWPLVCGWKKMNNILIVAQLEVRLTWAFSTTNLSTSIYHKNSVSFLEFSSIFHYKIAAIFKLVDLKFKAMKNLLRSRWRIFLIWSCIKIKAEIVSRFFGKRRKMNEISVVSRRRRNLFLRQRPKVKHCNKILIFSVCSVHKNSI